jgi:uncharacterized membrane protein
MGTPGNDMPVMAKVVERNVNALLNRKKEENKNRTIKEKIIDGITAFAGSMPSVYIHFILFGSWIIWNMGWLGLKPFDHEFIILATFAAVEAIFLSTFVLIGQKRMNIQTDKWAELDLQISLLTEHELTRVMTLVKAIAKKMDISEADDKEIEELSKDIHPEKVLDTMEKASK